MRAKMSQPPNTSSMNRLEVCTEFLKRNNILENSQSQKRIMTFILKLSSTTNFVTILKGDAYKLFDGRTIFESVIWSNSMTEKSFDIEDKRTLRNLLRHFIVHLKIITIIRVVYHGPDSKAVHGGVANPYDKPINIRQYEKQILIHKTETTAYK